MRGIPSRPACEYIRGWISPAHAGNTTLDGDLIPSASDQPRTCGEYLEGCDPQVERVGSAPHMRGIPRPERQAELFRRISPAHAGNTRWEGGQFGEGRISPAHAGNTRIALRQPLHGGDQPRTCGEYSRGGQRCQWQLGSAPHMRGIHGSNENVRRRGRISPAHAGNTDGPVILLPPGSDQPRTCGEYSPWPVTRAGSEGSAPHMRGILPASLLTAAYRGISPAHAGNTEFDRPP